MGCPSMNRRKRDESLVCMCVLLRSKGDARKSWAQRKPADIKVMRGEAYETTDRFERDSPTWEKQQDSFKRITHWELAIQRITQ